MTWTETGGVFTARFPSTDVHWLSVVDLLHPARPYLLHPLQDQTLAAFRR